MSAGVGPTLSDLWDVVVCPGIYGGVRVKCKGMVVMVYTVDGKCYVNITGKDPNRLCLKADIGEDFEE